MLQLVSIFFAMLSAAAATAATRDMRRARDAEWRDRWRREKERKLDVLGDCVVAVGEAAIRTNAGGDAAVLVIAQMKLGRAILDALNPWIDLEATWELERRPAGEIDSALVNEALNAIANNIEEVRERAFMTRRDLKRELRR